MGQSGGDNPSAGHLESNRPRYAELSRAGSLGARRPGVCLEQGTLVGIRKLNVGGRWQRVLPASLRFGQG